MARPLLSASVGAWAGGASVIGGEDRCGLPVLLSAWSAGRLARVPRLPAFREGAPVGGIVRHDYPPN